MNLYCDETGGKLYPVVNFNNCGAKGDCIRVCPYDVFAVLPIKPEDKQLLSLKGKLKTFFFKKKAYVVQPENCHACGLCIQACPEKAIKLMKNR